MPLMAKEQALGRIRSWVGPSLKLLIAVGLIAWLFTRSYLRLENFTPFFTYSSVLSLLGLAALSLLFAHVRWVMLMKAQGISTTISGALPLTFIGLFFNFTIPGMFGGDLVKGYYAAKEFPGQQLKAASTVIVDRLMGLYGMMLLVLIGAVFNRDILAGNHVLVGGVQIVAAIFGAFSLIVGLTLSGRLRSHPLLVRLTQRLHLHTLISRIYDEIRSYRKFPGTLLLGLGLTLFGQTLAAGFFLAVASISGVQGIPVSVYFLLVPMGFIVGSIPIAPAGVGVAQVTFLLLFQSLGGPDTTIGQVGVSLHQLALFSWGLFGAYFFVRRR